MSERHHLAGIYVVLAAAIAGYATLAAVGKFPWPPWKSDKVSYKFTRLFNATSSLINFEVQSDAMWQPNSLAPGAYLGLEDCSSKDQSYIRFDINQRLKNQPPIIKTFPVVSIMMDTPIPPEAHAKARISAFCDNGVLEICELPPPMTTYAYAEVVNHTDKAISFEYLHGYPDDWQPITMDPMSVQAFAQERDDLADIQFRFNAKQLLPKAKPVQKQYVAVAVIKASKVTTAEKATVRVNAFEELAHGDIDLLCEPKPTRK